MEKREEYSYILNMTLVEKHAKYLRLPTVFERSKKEIFNSCKDKIWARIQSLSGKSLSRVGKEVLIKAVVQAIPSYLMSLIRFPYNVIDDIHSMIARFW